MLPYKTQPVLKERIWGGQRLQSYHKLFEGCKVGESWETPVGQSGIHVLVKLLDANDVLSVQVHPDDGYAQRYENQVNGKSEMWVILECDDDAFIVYGFAKPLSREELLKHIGKGMVSGLLNYVKVRKGDCIYIPAGTVHTLGGGIVAYEVQQPSDLTYRLYDWERADENGKARELHIDRALDAIDYSAKLPAIKNIYDLKPENELNLISCPYFTSVYHAYTCGTLAEIRGSRPIVWSLLNGRASIIFDEAAIPVVKGDTVIIPQGYDKCVHIDCSEDIECIKTMV